MKKIQTFFHRRKRTMAFFLAGAIAAASFVPKLVSAYNLDDGWYSSPQAECTWGDNSLAMQNKPAKYVPTGLAFNSAVYTFNPALLPPETASKLNINEYWGLGAQNFLVMRPGYENSEFAMFDGRHTYCAGTHEVAAGIQPGAQAFAADENGFSLPNKPYAAAHKGSNPDFKTEYFCEAITPGTMGIHLSEDKFADHLNIQNHGFIAVLDPGSTSSGMQGQKPGGETGIQSGGSVLPADKEPEADKSGGVTASGLLGLMIKSAI